MTDIETQSNKQENIWKLVKPLVFKTIIGSVIAAALVAVLAIIVGDFNTLSLQLFLTIVVVIAFTLLAWYDADVSSKRSHSFALVGVGVSVYLLIMGFIKVWIIDETIYPDNYYYAAEDSIGLNFFQWIGLVFIARVALLHAHLLLNIHRRYVTSHLQIVAKITIILIALLGTLLSVPLIFDDFNYSESFWRFVSAVAIFDLLGTILIPLSHALFRPRTPQNFIAGTSPTSGNNDSLQESERIKAAYAQSFLPAPSPVPHAQRQETPVKPFAAQPGSVVFAPPVQRDRRLEWPRYVDGTPLPAREDGSPNFDEVERYPR